jgi:hypothetical protein
MSVVTCPHVEHELSSILYRDRGDKGAAIQRIGCASLLALLTGEDEKRLLSILSAKYTKTKSFNEQVSVPRDPDKPPSEESIRKRKYTTKKNKAKEASEEKEMPVAAEPVEEVVLDHEPLDTNKLYGPDRVYKPVEIDLKDAIKECNAFHTGVRVVIEVDAKCAKFDKRLASLIKLLQPVCDLSILVGCLNPRVSAADFIRDATKMLELSGSTGVLVNAVTHGNSPFELVKLKAKHCREEEAAIFISEAEGVCNHVRRACPETLVLHVK